MYNVHLGLIDKCNLDCKHCYIKSKNEQSRFKVDEEILLDVLNTVGCGVVTYTYGENLLYNNFYSFAQKVKEMGLYQILISNGRLISSQKDVVKLEEIGINKINISLDSSIANVHDYNRGMDGSFNSAINALHLLRESKKISTTIATTLTKGNVSDWKNIIKIGLELNVRSFSFMRNRTKQGLDDLGPLYEEEMKKLILYSVENDLELNMHDCSLNNMIHKMYVNNSIDEDVYHQLKDMNSCHIYRKLILISPCGNVYPCVFSDEIIGNIYIDNLFNIFSNKDYRCFCLAKG